MGSLSFAALAMAVTAVIPNADAAPPIVNATILPLLFLSGVFIPISGDTPAWINTVSNLFPVRHFADAMRAAYLGNVHVQGTTDPRVPVRRGATWPSSPCGGSSGSSSRAGTSAGNPASSSGDATLGRRPGRAVIRTGSRG